MIDKTKKKNKKNTANVKQEIKWRQDRNRSERNRGGDEKKNSNVNIQVDLEIFWEKLHEHFQKENKSNKLKKKKKFYKKKK